MLLPSGPHMVHKRTATQDLDFTITKIQNKYAHANRSQLVNPAYSGLQVQGTTNSPLSTALVLYTIIIKKSI